MKEWLKENWDKVLFLLIAIVVPGIVGFYSSISVVDDKITAISERVTINETEIGSAIKPKLSSLDSLVKRVSELEQEIDHLKRQNDIATQTKILLDLRLEEQREKTLKEINKLLKKP